MYPSSDDRDGLRGQNIIDELMCRCLDQATFGTDLDNEENDVPLYDQYNRGLTLCEEGIPRQNLQIEGKRPGVTGYVPSMEEALEQYPASSPRPRNLVMDLGEMSEAEQLLSAKRRGLIR